MGKSKKTDTITVAKPHTIKKFELIERYVDEWARKILGFQGAAGRKGSEGLIYIDCMSNCGVYKDIDGNLVDGTAIRVAKRLNEIIANYPGKMCLLLFNDISQEKIDLLRDELDKLQLTNINISYNCGDCNSFLRSLDLKSLQKQCNTLLLYDPYDASIDWDAVTPFLNIWGEVIINHMVSDTNRGITQAKKKDAIKKYQETYQKDVASIIEKGYSKQELNNIIIDIIRNNTSKARNKRYIASFPFFTRSNGLLYNLIYVSGNIEGLKLFKRVAWKTFGDKSSLKNTHGSEGQLMFSLDGSSQFTTMTDEECYYVKDIAKDIYEKFHSRGNVKLGEIYRYLDGHPIFPSDGYKNEIRNELKQYAQKVPRSENDNVIFLP